MIVIKKYESGDYMKKRINIFIILIVLVLVATLSGCKKKDLETTDPVNGSTNGMEDSGDKEKTREQIMSEFDNILVKGKLEEVIEFIDENITKLSQIEGDKMVSELEGILYKSLDATTDKILQGDTNGELMRIAGTELFFPEDKIKDIQDEKFREEITKIINSKYKLINLEESYYPIPDYEKMKQYNSYISDEIKEYIEIKAIDSNEPVAVDAGLRITYDDLASRIVKIEKYIEKYSGGQKYEEMLGNYKNKLAIYLGGLDNTPIADYQTKKIFDDVLESYKKTSNIKDSSTAFVVKKYISAIEENDLVVNKAVEDKVVSIVNEALALLEVSK